jgi:uncharacterized repeat protein (TIGR03803 family)
MYPVSLGRSKTVCAVFLFSAAAAIALPAQTFNTLVDLGTVNGEPQYMSLVQGTDGNLYGTSTDYFGSIFKVTSAGALSTVYQFAGINGSAPSSGLTLGTDGNLYGTTETGGTNSGGTAYKVTPKGTEALLYSFGGNDPRYPSSGLVQAANGSFYGSAYQGGSTACRLGCGAMFRVTSNGTFSWIHDFVLTDGEYPQGPLVQASNGLLYGTTTAGGANIDYGTVFQMTPTGTLTTLHSFDSTDGCNPQAGLVLATNGSIYGTTTDCGANGYGTVFRITPSGKFTSLHSFKATDGAFPSGHLIQATDGNFYGTTYGGGTYSSQFPPYGYGTIFKITPAGTLTTLYNFADTNDGAYAYGGLVQGTNGLLYGTTWNGGSNGLGNGTVFSLDVGLGPFVKTLPTSGKVGSTVKILGTDLTGSTGVTFNGVAATFKVVSPTLITTAVPVGATTGNVQVVTPAGTLSSNVVFRVP